MTRLSSGVIEGSEPISAKKEGLQPSFQGRSIIENGLVPPPAELVVHASGEHADVAIVDIDRITSEGTAPSHRYGLVLQPDEVVFGSR